MNEAQFCRELRKSLQPHGWFIKFHGGQFTEPGVPDIIGCIHGQLVAIECKLSNNKPSEAQLQQLQLIKQAGGLTYIATLRLGTKPALAYIASDWGSDLMISRKPGGSWDIDILIKQVLELKLISS
jgi:Holliday junction resolvase